MVLSGQEIQKYAKRVEDVENTTNSFQNFCVNTHSTFFERLAFTKPIDVNTNTPSPIHQPS